MKLNYWFNVQIFIRQEDSEAQKKQISRRMQPNPGLERVELLCIAQYRLID